MITMAYQKSNKSKPTNDKSIQRMGVAMNCLAVQIEFAFKMAHVVCCGQKNLIASEWFFLVVFSMFNFIA